MPAAEPSVPPKSSKGIDLMANAATSKGSSSTRSRQGTGSERGGRSNERSSDARELGAERDDNYNLIAVLYHGLQGADQCAIYADDAEEAGDPELAEMMRSAGRTQAELARRAKQLLLARLGGQGGGRSDASDDEDDEDEDDDE
jgi:hypothetical protein